MSLEEGPGGAFGPDPSRRQRARYPLST